MASLTPVHTPFSIQGFDTSRAYEQDVRRVARALFPSAGGYAPVILDGRERDGVLNDGESIHIIEATCNPTKKKAHDDLQKSCELRRDLNKLFPNHTFKIWLITEKDPTADQLAEAEAAKKKARCPVVALSLAAFSQKLVDAPSYLEARQNYAFGSIRNPDPKAPNKIVSEKSFIPIDMIISGTSTQVHPDTLAENFDKKPGIFLLLGDFGSGKSMTMRHVFYKLRDSFRNGSGAKFPIYLNLRDHIGQDDPSSALFDHGTRIGFSNPERLVRAWRAGFAHILLDGFDEISSSRFRKDSKGLRAVRMNAMTLVRKFVDEHPSHLTTLFISGRENYFGTAEERSQALGLSRRELTTLTLNEFTTDQVREYLKRAGLADGCVPDWLPSRPLLVGYLAVRGVLNKDFQSLNQVSRAEGWDYLLEQVCIREGQQITDLGGQVENVRAFFDRIATKARSTSNGRGPILLEEITHIFRQVMPSSPDDAAQQLLIRMAGLTVSSVAGSAVVATAPDQEDAREFVDSDLVDASRAGDVFRFVTYNFDDNLNSFFSDPDCTVAMGDLGIEVAAWKLRDVSAGQMNASLINAVDRVGSAALAMDILNIMRMLGVAVGATTTPIIIKDGYFNSVEIGADPGFDFVRLDECMITNLFIDRQDGVPSGPKLRGCQVENLYGAVSRDDLPRGILGDDTDIGTFAQETEGVVSPLPATSPAVAVLLKSLDRLFIQAGRGRKDNAFSRGLGDVEKAYVQDILHLIAKFDFASPHKMGGPTVWLPNRAKMKEVMSILRAPQQSISDIIAAARKL